ncbi:MAG: methionine--tRNA ligase [Chloroflexi bacterium]|nr:methionine--tRNA ligase [Chloroflexota bacterium]
MPERIFIGVAWPYANGPIHVGHLAGCYLAADIFARYHRAIGSQVLMVSGSDQHGTPITVLAEKEGVTPQAIVDRYHPGFLDTWRRLGITFDLFTTTGTENHARTFREVFDALHKKGVIYKASMPLPYCHTCKRFLPDRYVEGTCPFCGFQGARGDQCDNCGKTLDPVQLIDLTCRISGDRPEIRESEHLFFKLSDFQQPLLEWVRRQEHWRPNVRNFTLGYLEEGLKDRAITRDISWGVPVPLEGWESKRIYVWFEAVCGYLSASKEWAQRQGKPEAWRDFWQGEDCRSYYFIGKDNIPFHTIIWPALLLGHGGRNLPYDVPANEFMNLEGRKLSTSRNWAVWAPDYLDKFDPDPLRYYLSAAMPETSDADFSWREFLRRNNDELVATYGNLVHRVLTFSYRNFDKCVPEPGPLGTDEAALLAKAQEAVKETGANLGACKFKLAIGVAFSLAQGANRYLDSKAPWAAIKTDRRKAATTLWTAIQVIAALKTSLYPFLPFSAAKLHAILNLPGAMDTVGWAPARLPGGHAFNQPQPLFRKLEQIEIATEVEKLHGQSGG